jgi:hypothetical protein
VGGQNITRDTIRKSVIYDFEKTPAAIAIGRRVIQTPPIVLFFIIVSAYKI